jgi:UDP-N-acetylmuramoyl-L-alanyl-D-glutamate--2,6-diaminopimelate ligase
MLLLHTLLKDFDPGISLAGVKNVEVRGVSDDSRLVEPGFVFVARSGAKTDGRRYLNDAHIRGAIAAVADSPIGDSPLPLVLVKDAASAASRLANLFYGLPAAGMQVLGVTGTNGKTTTTYLIRHLLASVGRRCGMIGTVETDDGRGRREANMTTPGAVEIAQLLAAMRQNACDSCAIEVSSHALDQGRVAGVKFAGAAFTNLTGDHLDYHKTMESYAAAKTRLFESLDEGAVAVVNAGDPWSNRMVGKCTGKVVSFNVGDEGDYRAERLSITADGSSFLLITPNGQADCHMQMIGRHNIANALTAAALVGEVCGLTVEQMAAALADAGGAPGRLQPVRCGQGFGVFVDYAHSDDGLENVLSSLRPLVRGKLRVVFGCGGDRDRTKRPRMARVAERLADVIYLTSDNPRTENPESILEEIISGLSADVELSGAGRAVSRIHVGKEAIVEPDRRVAIERAISEARDGDIVLLAGKGHENYQIVQAEKRHFDDVEEAERVLREVSR